MRDSGTRAILLDFDGVVVDSEPLHGEAKQTTLRAFGIPCSPDLIEEFKGRTDQVFFDHVAARLAQGRVGSEELQAFKRGEFRRIFDGVQLVPGVGEFVRRARALGKKIGLASSTTELSFHLARGKFGFDGWFDAVVTAADTRLHKPNPDPYLKVLEDLHVGADVALAIEDSPNGVVSARAAGCRVAALRTSFDAPELIGAGAELVVAGFEELAVVLGFDLS